MLRSGGCRMFDDCCKCERSYMYGDVAWIERYYVCFFFFFFQAEDGIRDLTVTGVQTCALPISGHTSSRLEAVDLIGRDVPQGKTAPGARGECVILQAPRQEVFLLSTHQIGRIERQQRVALLDALAHVVRVEALHPPTDPSVDVHEVGLGVLQYPDCPHRGSYRALGGPCE